MNQSLDEKLSQSFEINPAKVLVVPDWINSEILVPISNSLIDSCDYSCSDRRKMKFSMENQEEVTMDKLICQYGIKAINIVRRLASEQGDEVVMLNSMFRNPNTLEILASFYRRI